MKPANDAAEVLTPEQVADWLQIKKRQLERFKIPCIHLGNKTRRYLRSDVLDWLKKQRKTA